MQIHPLNILMADDDEEDLELMEDMFKELHPGVKLYKMKNGREVIDFLNRCRDADLPSLIILDYNMPELNGAQVLNLLNNQERFANIPKLILSTSSAPLHIEESMKRGAAGYFVKPDNLHDLEMLTNKMLSYCKPLV